MGVNTAPFDTSKLSREGQQLVDGFRQVVMDAKKLVDVKNEDELLQNFIWNTRNIDVKSHKENLKSTSAPVDRETAQNEGQQAVEHLRVLAKLVFTNSEVRKLLSDVTVLGRDVAADAAQKVAEKARPSEDALGKVDEPAPENQWIGPNGEKRGPNDRVPDTGVGAKVDQAKEKKEEVRRMPNARARTSRSVPASVPRTRTSTPTTASSRRGSQRTRPATSPAEPRASHRRWSTGTSPRTARSRQRTFPSRSTARTRRPPGTT